MDSASYICALCGEQFEQPEGREEQAQREAMERYGKDGSDPSMVKVCEDCFQKMRRMEDSIMRARTARWN